MVNSKHLATFILGAAAGAALLKYANTEEGQQMVDKLKEQAAGLQDKAQDALSNAPEYFEKLKTEGAAALKEHFPDAEKWLQELLGQTPTEQPTQTAEAIEIKSLPPVVEIRKI